ncbi:MAG: NAD(P)H-dependent oxidoreductase [Clostridia bacterium]|nr:NAD(P)H-dependent oxidoreductase [Clostridia bacterium]
MHITVVNGSPKGEYSITLQTVLYIMKHHPEHTFETVHAGKIIKTLEKDMTPALDALKRADMILFSYPVYTFLAPSQLHRFIELVKESDVDLNGKIATQITTSKHFYDVTAHRYIRDNCADLGMKQIRGLSADMDDLLTEKGRQDALRFFDHVLWCTEHNIYETDAPAVSGGKCERASVPEPCAKQPGARTVIVADLQENDDALRVMIDRFRAVLPMESEVVNIREFPFRGGCISCFNCAADGTCIYKDGFDAFLREKIQTADAIVIAFSIKDHSMGARFKLYDDRQFCNGHRTVTEGTPFGYLVHGNLSAEENLRMVIDGRAQVGGNFLAGVACDEKDPDGGIDRMARMLDHAVREKYTQPSDFLGVGGMKIFRDLIWLMQGLMRADHRFFKSHGQYDFPQKKRGTMVKMYLVGALMTNKKLRAKAGGKINDGMIGPYKKVLEEE